MLTNQDTEKLQKAAQSITAKQNELSSEELQAFLSLITFINGGNYSAAEGISYIYILKNGIVKHTNNRLLQMHLKNFIEVCNKCFSVASVNTRKTGTNPSASKKKSNGKPIITVATVNSTGIVTAVAAGNAKITATNGDVKSEICRVSVKSPAPIRNNYGTATNNGNSHAAALVVASLGYTATHRLLTEDELRGFSKTELRILRNEIYARHGRKFKSTDLQQYFLKQSWYRPLYDEVSLTDIEQRNVEFIKQYE
jgi:hypothetical protein